MIGQTFSHYRVTAKLGAGGMGEVYRATDSRLGREVALKVLPEAYARDAHRMARFDREAQVLASLNHPNIASLYGFEDENGARALVMELVEGPTLAERLKSEALPLEEALGIARQITEALEAAHERGIIHRDLKPSNIKVTPEGRVKLLDFGLARALAEDPQTASMEHSPTLSAVATMSGIILGTAGYMSPEQAKGKPVDRRADIWSFGAVLYEMIAGRQLYSGETASEILAAVIKEEPDWSALPAGIALPIRKLLRRCLTKEPARRLQAIGEARIALEEYLANPTAESAVISASGISLSRPVWRRALPWSIAAILAVALGLALRSPWKGPTTGALPMRLSVELGTNASLRIGYGSSVVLSPDGTTLVFVAEGADRTQRLYLRPLAQTEAAPLSGTEGAESPFFSPDGQWIAFFSTGELRKVSLQGGAPVALCAGGGGRGGSWSDDGTIVFAPEPTGPLFRVSSAGGKPELLTKLDTSRGEITQRWPQVLPGGQAVLFTANSAIGTFSGARIVLYSLKDGTRKEILPRGVYARYLPSGHLAFLQEGKLFAAPFDLTRLEMTGQPIPVVEGVAYALTTGGAQFSFSQRGSLVYVPGKGVAVGDLSIQWLDARGQLRPLRKVPTSYADMRFSPDGKRLAVTVIEPKDDIWVYDWERDTMTRLTFEPGTDENPVWNPDGKRLAFASDRHGGLTNIYWQRADGTGPIERLTESRNAQFPWSWTPDGKALLFVEIKQAQAIEVNNSDIWMLPMEGDERTGWKPGKPEILLNSPFREYDPTVSPDGRWLAYSSDESGKFEVYVRPFPRGGGKWQVSSGGGLFPAWSPNGKELFYETAVNGMGQITVAAYSTSGGNFRAERPRLWSPTKFAFVGVAPAFAIHPDGKRFAVLTELERAKESEINKVTLYLNFFDELRRRVPASER